MRKATFAWPLHQDVKRAVTKGRERKFGGGAVTLSRIARITGPVMLGKAVQREARKKNRALVAHCPFETTFLNRSTDLSTNITVSLTQSQLTTQTNHILSGRNASPENWSVLGVVPKD